MTSRTVALKLLYPSTKDAEQRALIEEARRAAKLIHPHVATIYDAGIEGDRAYSAMEYVEGETLADWIRRGSVDIGRVLIAGIQVAEALQAAHDRYILHCDVKPSNIALTRGWLVKSRRTFARLRAAHRDYNELGH